ncbi:Sugar transporter [Popillia japonica]|uniref:Sugar transporter n=1 Tax=Popillia japonica TaxID=7064 RepID=A0AAW1LXJ1_POPJA
MKYTKHSENNGINIFLYFTAIVVHITSAVIGITFCWSTPVTSKLEGLIDNPLGFSISVSQSSWLSSLTSLGAVVGPFSGGYFSDSIGRKWSLIESPCYLIMKGQHEEARKSLEKLRQSDNIEDEIMELTATVKESLANRGGIIDVIKTDYLCRGLIITTGIVIIQQFSAISPILLYMHEIFENAGSSLSKEYATIIVGVVQIVATLISSFVIDRLGRRPLMFISIVPLCISLLTLSLYFYLKSLMDVSHISWLPVTALLVYVIFFNMGMGPLAIVVLSEIFPPHVKSSATSFTIATCFFVSFGVSKVFPLLGALFGQWFPFLICGVATTVGIIFMWFRLPETKGKHLSEILESLK